MRASFSPRQPSRTDPSGKVFEAELHTDRERVRVRTTRGGFDA